MVSLTVVGPGRYQLNPPLSPLAIFAQKISPHFTFQLKELLCCEIAYSMITIKVRNATYALCEKTQYLMNTL